MHRVFQILGWFFALVFDWLLRSTQGRVKVRQTAGTETPHINERINGYHIYKVPN
jgi:hypothetical protein